MSQTQTQTTTVATIPAAVVAANLAIVAKNETPKSAGRTTTDKAGKAKAKGSAIKASPALSALVDGVKKMGATMVVVGGTDAEPTYQDAADAPSVTFSELSNTGSVLQSLAFNFLAGTVDKSITTESLANMPRALRNEKGAINVLLGHKAGDIRAAWAKEMESRKRKDMPSLRTLAALVKGKKAKGPTVRKIDVADILRVLEGRQSDKMKVQMIRELCADKDE